MTEALAGTAASALFQHCVTVYNAFDEIAEDTRLDPHSDETGRVVTCFTTKLFAEIGLSVPYYSKIMQLLTGMDCVRQLRRGGGPSPSQWLLVQPPTPELFASVEVEKKGADAPEQQRWDDLNRRVGVLEDLVQTLIDEVFPQEG